MGRLSSLTRRCYLLPIDHQGDFLHMCSQEGLHDFQNEEYMVSYLGIAQLLLLLANLEYLSTVDKSHSSWGPSIFSLRRAIKKNCKLCVLSHVWLWNPTDCSPPVSSVHGIFRARILEWVAIFLFPGDVPNPAIKAESLMSPALAGRFLMTCVAWEALVKQNPIAINTGVWVQTTL